MDKEKTKKMVALLKKDREGILIIDIAKSLGVSRNTMAVALAELKGAKKVRIRPVGRCKLHYWKRSKNER